MDTNKSDKSRVYANMKCEKLANSKSYRGSVKLLDMLCIMFSMLTLLADIVTDILLAMEYWRIGCADWCVITSAFIVVPVLIMQVFSIRWYMMDDESVTLWHWISHIACMGLIHRYIQIIRTALEAKNSKSPQEYQRLFSQQSDLYMLHLFESCLEAAPQFVFQIYVITYTNELNTKVVVSSCCSIVSITCAALAYGQGHIENGQAHIGNDSMRNVSEKETSNCRLTSMLLKVVWRLCTFSARITALILFALLFNAWIFIPLACHWLTMTMWIVYQNTNFCSTKFEEILYNTVVGFMYCFCYFNLKDGQTRYRIITFYSITVTQNVAIFVTFLLLSNFDQKRKMTFSIIGFITIIGGTLIGLFSMTVYYRWFHPTGSIKWKWNPSSPVNKMEVGATVCIQEAEINLQSVRSLKLTQQKEENGIIDHQSNIGKEQMQLKTECTDNKFLLDHWIARTGTPTFASVPILNTSDTNTTGVEFHSIKNTPEKNDICVTFHNHSATNNGNKSESLPALNIAFNSNKRKGIFSSSELTFNRMKGSLDDAAPSTMNDLQKRRGICSSDELNEDLNNISMINVSEQQHPHRKTVDKSSEISQDTDSLKQKTSSDSIDCDLDLSFSDINSSDINEFNENIVQKLCLSTLKNIKDGNQDADIKNIQRIAVDILKEMYSKKGNENSNKSLGSFDFNGLGRDSDTPSEMLSVHDYENICAVNIAREAWGLRSWGCYSDIENWVHDDSTVREGRLDTLTSASSEICSNISMDRHNCTSPPPVPARKPAIYSNILMGPSRERQVDYIDTLVYEMAKCEDSICDGAIICKNSDNRAVAESNIFVAKPYVIDQNGGLLPLTVPLEPILEELDDINEHHEMINKKQRLNSECSLVATIDEIRKDPMANSPRNVYHRSENTWDSPQLHMKQTLLRNLQTNTLSRSLWKDRRNIGTISKNELDKQPDKTKSALTVASLQSIKNNIHLDSQFEKHNLHNGTIDRNSSLILEQKTLNIKNPDTFPANTTNTTLQLRRRSKSGLKTLSKVDEHDLSHKEVLFLSNLAVDSIPSSNLDDPNNYISSSLQSLIAKDGIPEGSSAPNRPENSVRTNKNLSNRPRRKFSLLRERFESKCLESDKEVLFNNSETKVSSQTDTNIENGVAIGGKVISDGIRPGRRDAAPSPPTANDDIVPGQPPVSWESCDKNVSSSCSSVLKQKRSLFLKQVLSPQKFNSKTKK